MQQKVFQLFARDSGQMNALGTALRGSQSAVVFCHPTVAEEGLVQQLREVSDCQFCEIIETGTAKNGILEGRAVVILGSKEYAAEILSRMPGLGWPSFVLLSDDSLDSAAVSAQVRRLGLPVRVAALHRPKGARLLLGFDTVSIETEAKRLMGRSPGPYFLTSWVAVHLALLAVEAGYRGPDEILGFLQKRVWQTAFGPVRFEDCGRAEGFNWQLRDIT